MARQNYENKFSFLLECHPLIKEQRGLVTVLPNV